MRHNGGVAWHRLRAIANMANLTTPLGLLVALAGGARPRRGPEGLWVCERYRFRYPRAGAFTVGNVVTTSATIADLERALPGVLRHEARHASQYALLGTAFFPLYSAFSAWSWLRCRSYAHANPLERHAGLVSGGYLRPGRPDA